MSDSDTTTTGWLLRALPALTFLVGLAVGGGFVWVGVDKDDSASDRSTAETTEPTGTDTTPDTAVVVPAACSDAADAVTEAVELIREGASSVRDFQPEELIRVLDDLEALDPRLQALAKQCAAVDVSPVSPPPTE